MNPFSFLTFNSFAILGWTTRLRLLTLARELNDLDLELICLQEIQTHMARRVITTALEDYDHIAYVPHLHCPRGGLITVARSPFVEEHFVRYEEQGRLYTPTVMDWILRKGVLITRTLWHGVPIVVMNTHLIANYTANWSQTAGAAQLQINQLRQLAALVRSQPANAVVLVAGDFNVPRGSWLYEEFLQESGLRDTLADDDRATYRPLPGVPSYYALPIDFVFVRAPKLPGFHIESQLAFSDKVELMDSRQGYLSDHLAIHTTLHWDRPHIEHDTQTPHPTAHPIPHPTAHRTPS
ncbi:MAG: endonuclease/exonuclease/phosphatase family protein [Litorilinea sp.]